MVKEKVMVQKHLWLDDDKKSDKLLNKISTVWIFKWYLIILTNIIHCSEKGRQDLVVNDIFN